MFETHREFEIFLPGIFGEDEGNQAWERVSTRLNMLWFYVICLPADKEIDQLSKMLLISGIEGLMDLQKDTSATISEAYIVSPSHINGSDVWKMNLLDHILTGTEPMPDFELMADVEQHAHIYVLKDGQRFVDSNLGTKEDCLKNTQLLCQI